MSLSLMPRLGMFRWLKVRMKQPTSGPRSRRRGRLKGAQEHVPEPRRWCEWTSGAAKKTTVNCQSGRSRRGALGHSYDTGRREVESWIRVRVPAKECAKRSNPVTRDREVGAVGGQGQKVHPAAYGAARSQGARYGDPLPRVTPISVTPVTAISCHKNMVSAFNLPVQAQHLEPISKTLTLEFLPDPLRLCPHCSVPARVHGPLWSQNETAHPKRPAQSRMGKWYGPCTFPLTRVPLSASLRIHNVFQVLIHLHLHAFQMRINSEPRTSPSLDGTRQAVLGCLATAARRLSP